MGALVSKLSHTQATPHISHPPKNNDIDLLAAWYNSLSLNQKRAQSALELITILTLMQTNILEPHAHDINDNDIVDLVTACLTQRICYVDSKELLQQQLSHSDMKRNVKTLLSICDPSQANKVFLFDNEQELHISSLIHDDLIFSAECEYFLSQIQPVTPTEEKTATLLCTVDIAIHILAYFIMYGLFGFKENTSMAFKFYKMLAERGYAEALDNMGVIKANKNEHREAYLYFEAAYKKGSVGAAHNLAICYLNGTGVNTNKQHAFTLFKEAANQGYMEAIYMLGCCYFDGHGVDKNNVEAFKHFEKAAHQGHINATCKLGLCYLYGYGVHENEIRAFILFKEAAHGKDIEAIHKLGLCYLYGCGTHINETQALEQFEKAACLGHTRAINSLAMIFCERIELATGKSLLDQFNHMQTNMFFIHKLEPQFITDIVDNCHISLNRFKYKCANESRLKAIIKEITNRYQLRYHALGKAKENFTECPISLDSFIEKDNSNPMVIAFIEPENQRITCIIMASSFYNWLLNNVRSEIQLCNPVTKSPLFLYRTLDQRINDLKTLGISEKIINKICKGD